LKLKKHAEEGKNNSYEGTIAMLQKQLSTTNTPNDYKQLQQTIQQQQQEIQALKLSISQKEYEIKEEKQKLEDKNMSINKQLELMKQFGTAPIDKTLEKFFRAIKSIMKACKIVEFPKCFISYAWPIDQSKTEALQNKLLRLREHLTKTGIKVMLDINNLTSGITEFMKNEISTSNFVILIGTTDLKAKLQNEKSNVYKEYQWALETRDNKSRFILPLLFEGDINTSFPESIKDFLVRDFTNEAKYIENLTSLQPIGLIPTILQISAPNKSYSDALDALIFSQNY